MITRKITRCALIVAINIVFSYVLKFLPNVKPDTTFVIILAVYFSIQESLAVITATVLLRMCLYGGGTFVPFQWLAWTTIAIVAWLLREILLKSKLLFVIYAAVSGYIFGFIVSLDILLLYGFNTFIAYWLNGVLFDTFHLIGNCVFSIILLNTVLKAKRITEKGLTLKPLIKIKKESIMQTLTLPQKFEEFSDARKNGFLKVKALKEQGKKVAGVFCTFTPQEILDAASFVSVSLCGMSAETIPDAEVDLPKNLCPLIKSSYGFYVSDKCPYTYFSDLIVGETTCDGKKKMYELMGKGKKTFILHLPQGEDKFEIDNLANELRRFKEFLEKEYNVEITEEKLREAAKLRNIERIERRKLMEVQKSNPAPASGMDLYKTMDGVGFLFDEQERIDKLKGLREQIEKENNASQNIGKKRILVTGCPIGGVLDKTVGAIERNGGNVVCFENCAGLKACLRLVDENADDMIRAIAERYLSIGCAVMAPDNTRMNNLRELVKEFDVDGVVNVTLHACTTYDVESKIVADLMKEINMPYMSLECDYTPGDEGQLLTRLQAFIEMLK